MACKILYVEDNYENARLIERVVTAAGYELLNARTGLAGLAMAEAERPDLILLDINLPDIDGYEVARRLRQSETCQNTPIMAITANALRGDEEQVLASGCDYYMTKPINIRTLRSQIDAILAETIEPAEAALNGDFAE